MGFESISEISIVLSVCTLMAIFFIKLKQPSILGYIVTGVILGPYALQWIENAKAIQIIGSYGMLIMLFTVGLRLNVHEFKKVWKTAVTCVCIQILFGTLIGIGLSYLIPDLDKSGIALIACMIALSSTAVAIKILENSNEINTLAGSVVISILIAQDLALVPMIMVLRNFIFQDSINNLFFKMSISFISMIVTIMFLSKSNLRMVHKFFNSWIFKNSEVNALIAIASCLGFAAFAEHLGLSGVYGAFLCGFILGNVGPKHSLLAFTEPLSGMLMTAFFIHIGILFDIQFIIKNIFLIFIVVCIITLAKLMINASSLRILGWKKRISFEVSVLLSQISEFSFVLINIYSLSNNVPANLINWIISTTVLSLSAGALFIVLCKKIMDKS